MSVAEFFGEGGRLSAAFERFEDRPGQREMAEAVQRTLEHGGVLMVEAGTGVGKTLAYLLPALRSDRRVVVSTGTRHLQDQILHRDLPLLREQLGLEFTATVMKGRDNYLCRYRIDQLRREPLLEDPSEASWIDKLLNWSERTRSGDRAEVEGMPDRLKLWRDVNARADTCTGSKCPDFEDCWLTKLKRRASRSQVIVVNHHLFFADLALRHAFGAVLPDYDAVVFDEAHLVEETATLYFGQRVSSVQVEQLARDAEKLAGKAGGAERGGGGATALRDAAEEFFFALEGHGEGGRERFESAENGGPDLEGEWAYLSEALDEIVRRAEDNSEASDTVDAVVDRAGMTRDALERILARDDPGFVYGVERAGRTTSLSAAPIDVSDLLRERLFDSLHAAVLTSATLAVENRFDFFVDRLGVGDAETLQVESPFDYEQQALLYLPKRMPEPSARDFADRVMEECERLLIVSDGRAFLLFTSFANLHKVRRRLEEESDWPLFVQGEDSKVALVERFRTTPRAVLLGTSSFWHGVDVPGDALSLVVIDKLPFAVPSDPLVAARIQRLQDRGDNPFSSYQVPMAVLELKQGLGRLIRSQRDRGILAVLDPRLTSRGYGKKFLRSLPPFPIARDINQCAHFFQQSTADQAE